MATTRLRAAERLTDEHRGPFDECRHRAASAHEGVGSSASCRDTRLGAAVAVGRKRACGGRGGCDNTRGTDESRGRASPTLLGRIPRGATAGRRALSRSRPRREARPMTAEGPYEMTGVGVVSNAKGEFY